MRDLGRCTILAAMIVAIFMPLTSLAQNGRWVRFDLSTIGAYSSGVGDCSAGIVCFTPGSSRYILVFDIQVHEWQAIDVGAIQAFDRIKTMGHVAFASSDQLLFGYSAVNLAWDTIRYSGTILDTQDGWGCGENLAYFVTQQFLYIFDAESSEWVSFDYTYPVDYNFMDGWVKDDYVAIVLNRTYPAHPGNVVYSYHTKGFNEIDQGGYYTGLHMDHGFARFMETAGQYRLVGYSAYDNNFDVEIYTPVQSEYLVGAFNASDTPADEFTVHMDAFRYAVSYQYVNANHYAYDTRHGQWVHNFLHMVWPDAYSGNCQYAGQMASDFASYDGDNTPAWIIFDGDGNAFRTPACQLDTQNGFGFRLGGNCIIGWDNVLLWGYSSALNNQAEFYEPWDYTGLIYSGQDFHTITRWDMEADNMRVLFYNGRTNIWRYIDVPNHYDYNGMVTVHYYMHSAGPENVAILYSSYRDAIIECDLPDGANLSKKICGDLAYAAGSNSSILFNGRTGDTTLFNFNITTNSQNGLGTQSAVFCDNPNNMLYGYGANSQIVTTFSFSEEPYFCLDSGYVGIMTVFYNGNGYNKIYTFNSLADSWVEMIPVGAHQQILVGDKTALVSRNQGGQNPDYVYAFDPQRLVSIIENGGDTNNRYLPAQFTLSQNFPNPFNSSTTIEYSVAARCNVSIDIFDILGRKIESLAEGLAPAGNHRVIWNAKDRSSGIYFYRIKVGDKVETKRMTLLN